MPLPVSLSLPLFVELISLFVHAYRKCRHMNALMCWLECQICYSLAKSYHMSWECLGTFSLWSSSGKYYSLQGSHVVMATGNWSKLISFHKVGTKVVTDQQAFNSCIEYHPPFSAWACLHVVVINQITSVWDFTVDNVWSAHMRMSSLCVGAFPLRFEVTGDLLRTHDSMV